MLVVAVLLVFGQTRRFDFVNFDDPEYVSENAHVRNGLTLAGVAWAFRADELSANWHPLTWLSLMIDCQIYGPNRPGAFHLTNVLLHAANSVLLLLILRRMTGRIWPSAVVAAVFAVHPLHVESVAWVTERKDVLSGLFGLLAIWAYTWYAGKPGILRYLAVAAALALGLMAKSMLVTWPLLLLLLDYWPLRRPLEPVLLQEKLPLLSLSVIAAAVIYHSQRAAGSVVSTESVSMLERIARAGTLYVFYLGKTFWPRNLAMYPLAGPPDFWPALAAAALLLLISAAAVWAAGARGTHRVGRQRVGGASWLAVGWFWYLGTLVPTIGLVQVGTVVSADRFVYLPQIGLCIAIAWTVAGLFRRWQGPGRWASRAESRERGAGRMRPAPCSPLPAPRSLACASGFDRRAWAALASNLGVALLLAVLAACAWRQASYWRDSETLWTHALDCTSRNFMAHFKLAKALERDDMPAALEHYRAAVEIRPADAAARNSLGALLTSCGDVAGAIEQFEAGLEYNPENLQLHYHAATLLARRGRMDAAITHYDAVIAQFERALEVDPQNAEIHANLATVLARRGRMDAAITHYEEALAIRPGFAAAKASLAKVRAGIIP